ncbi:MAG: NADH-quinone oxidoreductase subunit J [Proteobacteria bacterium]|nr:MAG: NADH-quinone oxidoreductase subunit J [Pseudomonadota bacterium]
MIFVFSVIALVSVVSAVGVVALKNPIHSALSLVANLMMVAVLFAMLQAHFLAAVQIIVYAGAIMVLVLFMLMLLNVKSEPWKRSEFFWVVLAAVAGGCFLIVLLPLINYTFSGFSEAPGAPAGTVRAIGLRLYSDYVFAFEAASLVIMAAMAGAVMLAKRRYRDT